MAVEIELKAHLDDFAPVKERLSALGEYCRAYTKTDAYWLPAQTVAASSLLPPSGVRIRHDRGVNADGSAYDTVLVTCKTKEIADGIEVNDESEFTVSNAAPFAELLSRLGLRETHHKQKEGWAWTVAPSAGKAAGRPPILAELSQVAGLGWFLEIEIQPPNDHPQTVEESRRRLLSLLETLKIPADWIEPRPYTIMLNEIRGEFNGRNSI